ncbi:MAG TPA: hypothetical protein VF469_14100, partial [Kofleriaceae bacterium]
MGLFDIQHRHQIYGAPDRNRVSGPQRIAVAVVEHGRLAGESAMRGDDGDDASSEEALVELPDAAVDVDGTVLADAAATMDGERRGERGLVDGAAGRAGPRLRGRLAVEAAVRSAVVVLIEKRREADL